MMTSTCAQHRRESKRVSRGHMVGVDSGAWPILSDQSGLLSDLSKRMSPLLVMHPRKPTALSLLGLQGSSRRLVSVVRHVLRSSQSYANHRKSRRRYRLCAWCAPRLTVVQTEDILQRMAGKFADHRH